jgi:hypothetical protein
MVNNGIKVIKSRKKRLTGSLGKLELRELVEI